MTSPAVPDPDPIRAAIVTGLASEAARFDPVPLSLVVLVAGADADRAEAMAAEAIRAGANLIVSFGLAGGLAASAGAGRLILPDRIVGPGGEAYATHDRLRAGLNGRFPEALGGIIAGVEAPITNVADKARLRARFDAVACDMESHRVARAANRLDAAVLVVRAVVDGPGQTLPSAALVPIGPDGTIPLVAVLGRLARAPWQLPDMVALGRANARAHRSLGAAAMALGGLLASA